MQSIHTQVDSQVRQKQSYLYDVDTIFTMTLALKSQKNKVKYYKCEYSIYQ